MLDVLLVILIVVMFCVSFITLLEEEWGTGVILSVISIMLLSWIVLGANNVAKYDEQIYNLETLKSPSGLSQQVYDVNHTLKNNTYIYPEGTKILVKTPHHFRWGIYFITFDDAEVIVKLPEPKTTN